MSDPSKPEVKYRVLQFPNPRTKKKVLRPVIVERETYSLSRLVEYALNAGFVRGQHYDICGTVNGIIEAILSLGRQGKAVNLGDWLRVHGELTGLVDEVTRRVGPKNGYRVLVTPLKRMRGKMSDFNWVNADSLECRVRMRNVYSQGVYRRREIVAGKGIVLSGANILYNTVRGDSVIATWTDAAGAERHVELRDPTWTDSGRLEFGPPAEFADLTPGTEVTFTLRLHPGTADDSPEQVGRIVATVIAPPSAD